MDGFEDNYGNSKRLRATRQPYLDGACSHILLRSEPETVELAQAETIPAGRAKVKRSTANSSTTALKVILEVTLLFGRLK